VDLWEFVPVEWRADLDHMRPQLESIGRQLDALAQAGIQIHPPSEQIFAALALEPANVRVVILGQDPYPNASHAMGLAFSVPVGTKPLPPSLRNILAELKADVGECNVSPGNLEPWIEQGVLLLNRVLTVETGKTDSHKALGWQAVTHAIVEAVVRANADAVAILWGSAAQQLRPLFNPDCVIHSVHPSPLSAYRGFFGSRPFTEANRRLAAHNQKQIQW
jgi:uracil-DNA glycosylase